MTEGSGEHASREIAERVKRAGADAQSRHDRLIGISEAVVLSVVALITAWSGYCAAWFGAFTSGNTHAAAVAAKRFRPEYRAAFDAWLATNPFSNPDAPAGPQAMPQYRPTGQAEAVRLDATADSLFESGSSG